jgi:hypothetical protein
VRARNKRILNPLSTHPFSAPRLLASFQMFRAIVLALSLASASAFVAPAPARASVKVHETKAVSGPKKKIFQQQQQQQQQQHRKAQGKGS